MEQRELAGSSKEEAVETGGRDPLIVQVRTIGDGPPQVKQASEEETHQRWDSQWQEFLKKMELPPRGRFRSAQPLPPWQEGPKDFQVSFERAEEDLQEENTEESRGAAGVQRYPYVGEEAEGPSGNLDSCVMVKEELLEKVEMEKQQLQHLRQFSFQDVDGPSKGSHFLEGVIVKSPKLEEESRETVKVQLPLEIKQENDSEAKLLAQYRHFPHVMAEEILTQRGKAKFVHNGFLYTFDRESQADSDLKFWRCEQKTRCKARLHTRAGEVVRELNSHSHDASAAQVEVAFVKTKIKKRAAETLEAPAVVVNECLTPMSQASLATVPNMSAFKKLILRKRNAVKTAPPNPTDLQQLSLPECYRTYVPQPGVGENFLLCDSGPGPDRILIFGRASWLQFLVTSDTWFADGTFNITPGLFTQMFVISAKQHGGIHPVVYALLPDKQRTTYARMFNLLMEKEPSLRPSSIICEFEEVIHHAVRDVFPSIQIKGCFFHLAQNMQKQLAVLGITYLYNTDPDFALKAVMIIALAFVPMDKIHEYRDCLSTELPQELQGLLTWFEETFVGRQNRRGSGRPPPVFLPEVWNLHQRTLNGEERTHNLAEAAHRRLKYDLSMQYPTIWKLIDRLHKVQKGRDVYYERLLAGHEPLQKLKKYRDADRRIHETVLRFENMDATEYLRSIAHNYLIQN